MRQPWSVHILTAGRDSSTNDTAQKSSGLLESQHRRTRWDEALRQTRRLSVLSPQSQSGGMRNFRNTASLECPSTARSVRG